MFVTNWISTAKIQKISEITNFFRHYFLSRTEVLNNPYAIIITPILCSKYIKFIKKTGNISVFHFLFVLLWLELTI